MSLFVRKGKNQYVNWHEYPYCTMNYSKMYMSVSFIDMITYKNPNKDKITCICFNYKHISFVQMRNLNTGLIKSMLKIKYGHKGINMEHNYYFNCDIITNPLESTDILERIYQEMKHKYKLIMSLDMMVDMTELMATKSVGTPLVTCVYRFADEMKIKALINYGFGLAVPNSMIEMLLPLYETNIDAFMEALKSYGYILSRRIKAIIATKFIRVKRAV